MWRAATSALLLFTLAGPLCAQDSARGPLLEPLVVRAPRVPRLPLATTTLDSTALRGGRAALTLDEVVSRVPGLGVADRQQAALDTRLVVRGAGARAPFGTRGVMVVLDGVPQTLPDGQAQLSHVEPDALARVDIVRGPAAAFYGNGAGGLVSLSSAPLLGATPAARLRVLGGSFGLTALRAGWQGPLGAGGARVEAARVVRTGFRNHSASEQRTGSAAVAWPAGAWQIAGRLRFSGLVRADNPGALDSAQVAGDRTQASARNVAYRAGKTVDQWQASVEARHAGVSGDVTAIVYGLSRALDNPLPSAWVRLDRRDAGLRVLGRWRRAGAEVLGGLDVQHQQDERRNFDNDSGRIGSVPRLDQLERVTAAGARAALAVPLGRATRALGGVRLDRVAFRVADRLTADGDGTGRRAWSAVSGMGGVTHEIARGWRVHASAGTAFETPTMTELAVPTGGLNMSLAPQRSRQWEIGSAFERRRSRAAVTLYAGRTRDALVPIEDSVSPGRFRYVNAARLRSNGVEVEVETAVGAWLRAAASFSASRQRYVRFATDPLVEGRRTPGVPETTLWMELTAGTRSVVAVEVLAWGAVAADDANRHVAAAWRVLNARGALPLRVGRSRAELFGGIRNIANAAYVGSVTVNGAAGRVYEPSPRRHGYLGVELYL